MTIDAVTLAAIVVMALVTYATRVLGVVLIRRVAIRGRVEAALEAVPGSVLLAIIAPTVFATGVPETVAALATVIVAARAPAVAAIVAGVGTVVILRHLGL